MFDRPFGRTEALSANATLAERRMTRVARRRRLIVKTLRPFGQGRGRREDDAADFPVERANSRMGGPPFVRTQDPYIVQVFPTKY